MYGIREEQGEDEEYNLKDGSLKNVSFTHSNSILVACCFRLLSPQQLVVGGSDSVAVQRAASRSAGNWGRWMLRGRALK